MPRLSRWQTQQRESNIELSEQNGVRALHLGSDMVQSAMRLTAPNDLELFYTQCMMGFLLFHPQPENILMIGLGGGSLVKFVYHRMPQIKISVIEISPQVVEIARSHFLLPLNSERLQVLVAEGGDYIAHHPASTDILMVDGFNGSNQVDTLCSQDFYNSACETLNKNGILVINLLSRDKNRDEHMHRIQNSFDGHVITFLTEIRGNQIVFAFKRGLGKIAWEELERRAEELESQLILPFPRFIEGLRKYGSHSNRYLEI
ncbi:MAG: polyamine aminopropyltransferase [Nitrosomonadaceae bacterium]|nr:polyamine aminopropyltransferase [Nitrosomonadaceae bacterium]